MYAYNQKKIRRFLRDPNKKIWDDNFLRHLWNSEQALFSRAYSFFINAEVLRHPPQYSFSYQQDWEYAYCDPEIGIPYQCLLQHRQSILVCSYFWEIQQLGLSTGSESDTGYRYIHPWEGYVIDTPADLIPNWFPVDYHSTIKLIWDRKYALDFVEWKSLISRDIAYRTYQGEPIFFTVKDDVSKEFYLYPRPAPVWDDIDGLPQTSSITSTDFTTESSELGTPIDGIGSETTQDLGISTDYLRADNNVLLIYRSKPLDIQSESDEINFPKYMQKYIEYGVIARAYRANTDGKIKSLSDYWEMRKSFGMEVLSRFNVKRFTDRNYRLTSGRAAMRKRKGPRLPYTYPAV